LLYHFRNGREAGWSHRVGVPLAWFTLTVLAKASGLVFGVLLMVALEVARLWPADAGAFLALTGWWERLRPLRRDLAWVVGGGLVLVFVYCGSEWQTEPSFLKWAHDLPDHAAGRAMAWFAEHCRIFSNAGEAVVRQVRHNLHG